MERKAWFVASFALLYTIATPLIGAEAMGLAMSGFEPGSREAHPATVWIAGAVADALLWPLVPIFAPRGAPGLWGYLAVFGNGIIWGSTLVALRGAFVRRRGARAFQEEFR